MQSLAQLTKRLTGVGEKKGTAPRPLLMLLPSTNASIPKNHAANSTICVTRVDVAVFPTHIPRKVYKVINWRILL